MDRVAQNNTYTPYPAARREVQPTPDERRTTAVEAQQRRVEPQQQTRKPPAFGLGRNIDVKA